MHLVMNVGAKRLNKGSVWAGTYSVIDYGLHPSRGKEILFGVVYFASKMHFMLNCWAKGLQILGGSWTYSLVDFFFYSYRSEEVLFWVVSFTTKRHPILDLWSKWLKILSVPGSDMRPLLNSLILPKLCETNVFYFFFAGKVVFFLFGRGWTLRRHIQLIHIFVIHFILFW